MTKEHMSYQLIHNQTEVLQYLRGCFPMYHNSNLFFRDIQYGVQKLLKEHGEPVSLAEAEQRAAEFCKALQQQRILIPIDDHTWTLNYPPFRTPERKKAPEPPKPAAPKPEKPGTP